MDSQKNENLLNLSLEATEEEREKSPVLMTGFDPQEDRWELIVKYGGELSRIMLAVKTVLADDDDIPTLIFDEIDTGISGRTAQMVSEKLSYIGRNHQVLCITHLPQIASMADRHYLIEKSSRTGKTETRIHNLDGEESVTELARLLGGAQITVAVLENAREMKKLAEQTKLTK